MEDFHDAIRGFKGSHGGALWVNRKLPTLRAHRYCTGSRCLLQMPNYVKFVLEYLLAVDSWESVLRALFASHVKERFEQDEGRL